jgi:hypothetical protein
MMTCQHPQAEPVVLITGETVACVCISCMAQLRPDYIEDQHEAAYRRAYCEHGEQVEIRSFDRWLATPICTECGDRDPFVEELIDAMLPMNRDSAASVMPLVIRVDDPSQVRPYSREEAPNGVLALPVDLELRREL